VRPICSLIAAFLFPPLGNTVKGICEKTKLADNKKPVNKRVLFFCIKNILSNLNTSIKHFCNLFTPEKKADKRIFF
jgi:hypothetical protein